MSKHRITALRQRIGEHGPPAEPKVTPAEPEVMTVRAAFEQLALACPPASDVRFMPAAAGGVPAELATAPGATPDRLVLYLHGGGYTSGSPATHRALAAELGRAARARVLSLDYRLAPEHPFPAAVEDAVAAWRWLLAEGMAPGAMAIAGDSAGGGLAVATLVALREAGLPLPAAGFCLSPWADLEHAGSAAFPTAAEDLLVQPEALAATAACYLAGACPRAPLASPIHADLAGLPALLIQVGAAESLLDDAVRLAGRAGAAGVRVTLEIWPEMVHVWHYFAPLLTAGREAIRRGGAFLATAMV